MKSYNNYSQFEKNGEIKIKKTKFEDLKNYIYYFVEEKNT